MKKILSGFAGCIFIASIVLNIYYFGKEQARKVPEKTAEAKKSSSGKISASILPEKNFYFRTAEYFSWSNKIFISFTGDPLFTQNTVKDSIRITPSLPVKIEPSDEGELYLKGDFQPGTTYLVRIAPSLKSTDNRTLAQTAVFSIKIPDKSPKMRFLSQGVFLPLNRKKITLPYAVTNVKKASVEIRKYYNNHPESFNPYTEDSFNSDASFTVHEKLLTYSTPKNKELFRQFDLTTLKKKYGPGAYSIHFSCKDPSPRYSWESDAKLKFILTDLAILSALPDKLATGAKGTVFVRSLSTNKAVSGAKLTLISAKQQIFASGVTDNEGKCTLVIRRRIQDDSDRAARLIVTKGADTAYLDVTENHDLSRYNNKGRFAESKQEAFIYTKRGICRPGETISGGLFLRKNEKGKNLAVRNGTLTLCLTDPAGTEHPLKNVKTNEHGFAEFSFHIPDDARTGIWHISAALPGSRNGFSAASSHHFQVGMYVPDRIKASLKLKNDPRSVKKEDILTFQPEASYYFGAPLDENTRGVLFVHALPLSPLPAHWQDYTAGTGKKDFKAGKPFYKKFSVKEKNIDYPGFASLGGKSNIPVLLKSTYTVAEPGGRSVSAVKNIPCSVMETYLGLARKLRSKNEEVLLDWKLLALEKNSSIEKKERKYLLKLARREWKNFLKEKNGKYSYEWVKEDIPAWEKTIVSSENAGTFSLGKLEAGEYILQVTSGKMATAHTFWHNKGSAGARSSNMADLSLSTNKKIYKPGETAILTFESSAEGTALLAVSDEENLKGASFKVKAGKNSIPLLIPENISSGSFHAGITLITTRKNAPSRAFALATLDVDLSASRFLDVKMRHPEKALPGEEIDIHVELKDLAGKGQTGTVHIFGCDAGILALTDWKTPNIYEFFSGKKLCAFSFSDTYNGLFPDLTLLANGKFGGDAHSRKGLSRSSLLSNVKLKTKKPALISLGILKTDAQGKASGKVRLPDFTGSLLLSAVAADQTKTGSASGELLVRDRIGVTASLPRTTVPADVIEGAFTLFNFDVSAGEFSFELQLPENNKKVFTGKLARGGQQIIPVKWKAPSKTGNCQIEYTYTLRSGKEKIVKKGSLYFAVRHKNPATMESSFQLLPKGKSLTFSRKNAKWHPDTYTGKVTISTNPLSLLADSLDFLRSYPYGCLEQTAASAFPLLSANALYMCDLIGREQARTAKTSAVQAAYRILSMMRYDGSFSMWPGGGKEFRAGTLFASHFLFEAESKTSFAIPITARNLICRHLYTIADDAALSRGERAYAACILAIAKSSRFRNVAKNILAENKTDLAALFASCALIKGGYAAEGAYYMKEALDKEVWRKKNIPYSYADENVRMAMVLYLLCQTDAPGESCHKLFALLQKNLRTDGLGWGTTQANAWAVLGISAWANANHFSMQTEKGKNAASIEFANGKRLMLSAGKTAIVDLNKEGDFKLTNINSPGLFITEKSRGVLRDAADISKGITIKREYLNKEGKVVNSVSHGELITVRITTWAKEFVPDAVIVDLLPGGLEIEDENLATRAKAVPLPRVAGINAPQINFTDKRDDRYLLFCDLQGKQVYTYKARAVIRGKYALGAISAEKMYDPDTHALSAPRGTFEIK